MTLWEKIIALYPELEHDYDVLVNKTIRLQNDSDGRGDYIAAWEHPVFPKPTPEQMEAVK